jgi:hypothetical protein
MPSGLQMVNHVLDLLAGDIDLRFAEVDQGIDRRSESRVAVYFIAGGIKILRGYLVAGLEDKQVILNAMGHRHR